MNPRLEASDGEVKALSMQRLPDGNLARVAFHFVAGERAEAEFRLWLDDAGRTPPRSGSTAGAREAARDIRR